MRILTTLIRPDAGRAAVAGIDVTAHPGQVRRYIGVVGQDATLDSLLLGGLAQDDIWLIITRGFQGIGGAIASPTALSLIAANFP